ncbi:hypothetical protein EV360DRAFT_77187, partial [Lentinula raphanica]
EIRVVAQMLSMSESSNVGSTTSGLPSATMRDLTPSFSSQGSPDGPEAAPLKILWDVTWVPPDIPDPSEIFFARNRSTIFKLVTDHHRRMFGIDAPGIMVKGQNTHQLVEAFTKIVHKAIVEKDFSPVLSQNRHFQLVNIEHNGVENYVTSGPGVEKEVMDLFFKTSLQNAAGLLTNVIDDYTTIATVPLSIASDMSNTKRDELTHLGAVVGLLLVHGSYPGNLNPLLLVYLLNTCNLSSLSKDLVREFFPELHRTLVQWLSLDHDDNSTLLSFQSHFATYHNLLVSTLYGRSEKVHQSLAWTMLHNAIIGQEPADHPYFTAFMDGFFLPCGVLGLNLCEISQRFAGGSSEFVASLLDTRITGDYTKLRLDHNSKI